MANTRYNTRVNAGMCATQGMRAKSVTLWLCVALLTAAAMQQAPSAQVIPTPKAMTSGPSSTQELSPPVNPAHCKTGNKAYVYWAAKDQVFRFKYDPALPIHPYPERLLTIGIHFDARQEIPPAPIPSEPLGCYGNPLRALQIPYMDAFEAELFQKLWRRNLVRRAAHISGFDALPTNYYEFSLQERLFRKSTDCWQRPSGIHECLLADGTKKERTDYKGAHPLKIEKELLPKHPEVSDVYFTVQLEGPLAPNGQAWMTAKSQILLFGNVNLQSDFLLLPQEIDLLIPYYSGLIRYVLDAHVPDYKWTAAKTK